MAITDEDPSNSLPSARILFQPLVDLAQWRVVGFEALARFEGGGSPLDHLAQAERAGRREALELSLIAGAVQSSTLLPEGPFITLNASGTTMLNPELGTLLRAVDRAWGLELFEAATAADLATVRDLVTSLGGQLLVDDAGTSHADAARILALRPDIVKIDRSAFWGALEARGAERPLAEIIEAARAVHAQVLIEGIAEPEHLIAARELGAELGQGYHLGMPTAAAGMPEMLRELHGSIGVDAPGL